MLSGYWGYGNEYQKPDNLEAYKAVVGNGISFIDTSEVTPHASLLHDTHIQLVQSPHMLCKPLYAASMLLPCLFVSYAL